MSKLKIGYITYRNSPLSTGDVDDDETNDSMKVEMALEWSLKHCKGFKYMLKTGDDTFIHTKNLHQLIDSYPSDARGVYAGNIKVSTDIF